MGFFLIFCGMVALGFLVYTIINLKDLAIGISHPRMLVELILFLIFTTAGVYLMLR